MGDATREGRWAADTMDSISRISGGGGGVLIGGAGHAFVEPDKCLS